MVIDEYKDKLSAAPWLDVFCKTLVHVNFVCQKMTRNYIYPKWLMIVSILFAIGFLAGVYFTFVNEEYMITLVCGGLVLLGLAGAIDSRRYRLELTSDTIISHQLFRTKSLKFKDVQEFVVDEQYLRFIPKSKEHKKIRVSSYVRDYR